MTAAPLQLKPSEMKSWTVYKHISPSGKVYIGITSNVKRRWAASGYYYCLSNTLFAKALRKYGWENFQHVIIQEGLSKQEACALEKELIASYKASNLSYNITDGGEGTCAPHTEEHNKKISESHIINNDIDYLVIDKYFNYVICRSGKEIAKFLNGNSQSIVAMFHQPIGYTYKGHYIWKHKKGSPINIKSIKNKILNALNLRKQTMSEHTRSISSKMVEAAKRERDSLTAEEREKRYRRTKKRGWHHTEETIQKISKAAKGRDMSQLRKAAIKKTSVPVVQLLDGVIINTFNSISEAARTLNVSVSNIANCARGLRKTAYGFKWKYKKEKEVYNVA